MLNMGPILSLSSLLLIIVTLVTIEGRQRRSWPNQSCNPCDCDIRRIKGMQGRVKSALCAAKNLTSIPQNLPDDLGFLDVDNNLIESIDFDTISKFRSLNGLSLRDNPLITLQMNIFQNLTRLQYLYLTGCNLTDVPTGVFNNTKLMEIKGLKVDRAPFNLFEGLPQLRLIQLITDDENLQADLFDGLNLHNVDLTLTAAQTLPVTIFERESKTLRVMTIRGEHLTHFDRYIFRSLINLQEVTLLVQDMDTLPAEIFNSRRESSTERRRIKKIWIDGVNSLPLSIFYELPYLTHLTILNLRDHSTANFTLQDLDMIEYLDLSGNNISQLNGEWFQSSRRLPLKCLNLSRNHLTEIQLELAALDQLQTLNLSRNRIHFINANAFRTFRSALVKLDLSNNRLCSLHAHLFIDMYDLRFLWLNNNCISGMDPFLFYDISALKYLYLQHNEIDSLKYDNFTHLQDLVHLNISHNNISRLSDSTFSDLSFLKVLDLSNNLITSLPDDVISIGILEKVFLQNNPLFCDCGVRLLFDLINDEFTSIQVEASCVGPQSFAGKRVDELDNFAVCPWMDPSFSTMAPTEATQPHLSFSGRSPITISTSQPRTLSDVWISTASSGPSDIQPTTPGTSSSSEVSEEVTSTWPTLVAEHAPTSNITGPVTSLLFQDSNVASTPLTNGAISDTQSTPTEGHLRETSTHSSLIFQTFTSASTERTDHKSKTSQHLWETSTASMVNKELTSARQVTTDRDTPIKSTEMGDSTIASSIHSDRSETSTPSELNNPTASWSTKSEAMSEMQDLTESTYDGVTVTLVSNTEREMSRMSDTPTKKIQKQEPTTDFPSTVHSEAETSAEMQDLTESMYDGVTVTLVSNTEREMSRMSETPTKKIQKQEATTDFPSTVHPEAETSAGSDSFELQTYTSQQALNAESTTESTRDGQKTSEYQGITGINPSTRPVELELTKNTPNINNGTESPPTIIFAETTTRQSDTYSTETKPQIIDSTTSTISERTLTEGQPAEDFKTTPRTTRFRTRHNGFSRGYTRADWTRMWSMQRNYSQTPKAVKPGPSDESNEITKPENLGTTMWDVATTEEEFATRDKTLDTTDAPSIIFTVLWEKNTLSDTDNPPSLSHQYSWTTQNGLKLPDKDGGHKDQLNDPHLENTTNHQNTNDSNSVEEFTTIGQSVEHSQDTTTMSLPNVPKIPTVKVEMVITAPRGNWTHAAIIGIGSLIVLALVLWMICHTWKVLPFLRRPSFGRTYNTKTGNVYKII